jgi:hypothetical protein
MQKIFLFSLVFVDILKVNEDPDPDSLVRGMDPRIRIHTKVSWIRNTAPELVQHFSLQGEFTSAQERCMS